MISERIVAPFLFPTQPVLSSVVHHLHPLFPLPPLMMMMKSYELCSLLLHKPRPVSMVLILIKLDIAIVVLHCARTLSFKVLVC